MWLFPALNHGARDSQAGSVRLGCAAGARQDHGQGRGAAGRPPGRGSSNPGHGRRADGLAGQGLAARMWCGIKGGQASDTSPLPRAEAVPRLAPPAAGSLRGLAGFHQLHPEARRVGMGLWACANVSSGGVRAKSPADARGIHVHPAPHHQRGHSTCTPVAGSIFNLNRLRSGVSSPLVPPPPPPPDPGGAGGFSPRPVARRASPCRAGFAGPGRRPAPTSRCPRWSAPGPAPSTRAAAGGALSMVLRSAAELAGSGRGWVGGAPRALKSRHPDPGTQKVFTLGLPP